MVIGYSAILIPELQRPESRFKVDLELSTWIGNDYENEIYVPSIIKI